GDMTKSNILKDRKGNVFLTDWENADYAPISLDCSRLYLNHQKLREKILRLVDSYVQQVTNGVSSNILIAFGLESFLNRTIARTNGKLNRKQKLQDSEGRLLIEELLHLNGK
ncbi:MAG: hypothetical protein ACR2O0_09480, partial [Rhizobiaceae bacterium]